MQNPYDMAFSAFALHKGFVALPDLRDAIRVQTLALRTLKRRYQLSDILFIRNALTYSQVKQVEADIQRAQRAEESGLSRLGEVLVELEYATPKQLLEALNIQEGQRQAGRTPRLLGEVLIDLGVITATQLEKALKLLYERNRENIHRRFPVPKDLDRPI